MRGGSSESGVRCVSVSEACGIHGVWVRHTRDVSKSGMRRVSASCGIRGVSGNHAAYAGSECVMRHMRRRVSESGMRRRVSELGMRRVWV